MSEEQDKYWTNVALEKEKQMAYDDRSPGMVHPSMSEPMKVPQNVFEVLQELNDVMQAGDELDSRKRKLVARYQELMRDAENGFGNIMNRPETEMASEMTAMESTSGFGKPRFGF